MGYPKYGGRGIVVCDEWLNSFEQFMLDLGERPKGDYTLDRIDNDGDYEPGNCKWSTREEQQNNRSNNVTLTHGGETLSIAEWSKKLGINIHTLRCRMYSGKSTEEILDPKIFNTITFNGVTRTVSEWSKELGIPAGRIHGRLLSGMEPVDILSTDIISIGIEVMAFNLSSKELFIYPNMKILARELKLGLGTVQNRVRDMDTKPHRGYVILPYTTEGRAMMDGLI